MKRLKNFAFAWILCLVSLMFTIIISSCRPNSHEEYYDDTDTTNIVAVKPEEPKVQIRDILIKRECEISKYTIDSIYLHMPEISLIDILARYGTSQNREDIVREYVANYERRYSLLERGRMMNIPSINDSIVPKIPQHN